MADEFLYEKRMRQQSGRRRSDDAGILIPRRLYQAAAWMGKKDQAKTDEKRK